MFVTRRYVSPRKQEQATLELLGNLQEAIALGQSEVAARTAEKLADLKVRCNFILNEEDVTVPNDVYNEDAMLQVQNVLPELPVRNNSVVADEKVEVPQRQIDTENLRLTGVFEISDVSPKVISLRKVFKSLANARQENGLLVEQENSAHVVNIRTIVDGERREESDTTVAKDQKANNVVAVASGISQDWSCAFCTLINKSNGIICEACNQARINDAVPKIRRDHNDNKITGDLTTKNCENEPREAKFANYFELLNYENTALITNLEEFECPICFTIFYPGDGVVLKACLHQFCKDCLAQMIAHCTEAMVRCPYTDGHYLCGELLQEREVKELVSAELFEKYLARSLREAECKMPNTFHCKTANCAGWCIFENLVNEFLCPVCSQLNCLTCQVIHTGMNCKQYQAKLQEDSDASAEAMETKRRLGEMLNNGTAMRCPTCQIIILKKDGCDALSCTMCKTAICWVTKGPRWGSRGYGDTSGGCRCRVNNRKCHPDCGNCH